MSPIRTLTIATITIALAAACGHEGPTVQQPAHDGPAIAPVQPSATSEPTHSSGSLPSDTMATPSAQLGSQTVELDQPAVWPSSDVVFATPEEAAESFVTDVLGVEPVLSEYMGGDSRSGEIQVFSPGDGDTTELVERGLLGLRIIGPNDGWFVIAASSQGVTINAPETLDRVPAGPLVVSGLGRGFEGTVVVTAFRGGDADDVLDQVIAAGGAFEALEPFSVTLDLSDGVAGETIALLVRGDTGLDGDPGEFTSIPIVIGDPLPETS